MNLVRQKGFTNMHNFLKQQYGFSDYQIAQLAFTAKTVGAEISKLLIMGFIFKDNLDLYIFAVIIMMLMRSSTGGLHCRTYWGCFFVSLAYMFLALSVMPLIPVNKLLQMILLFLCILCNYYIGPVTSAVHRPLSERVTKRVKLQSFVIIFFYLSLTFIVPENPYITVGFWVIILHTLQLSAAKILKMKGERKYEELAYQN